MLTPPEGFFTGVSSCFSRFLTIDCTRVPGKGQGVTLVGRAWETNASPLWTILVSNLDRWNAARVKRKKTELVSPPPPKIKREKETGKGPG